MDFLFVVQAKAWTKARFSLTVLIAALKAMLALWSQCQTVTLSVLLNFHWKSSAMNNRKTCFMFQVRIYCYITSDNNCTGTLELDKI